MRRVRYVYFVFDMDVEETEGNRLPSARWLFYPWRAVFLVSLFVAGVAMIALGG